VKRKSEDKQTWQNFNSARAPKKNNNRKCAVGKQFSTLGLEWKKGPEKLLLFFGQQ